MVGGYIVSVIGVPHENTQWNSEVFSFEILNSLVCYYITFIHLADAFIQSDFQKRALKKTFKLSKFLQELYKSFTTYCLQ